MKGRSKILIVDDKPANLYALERVLHDADAEIVSANSGNEALIATLNHDFALAILDVQMPEMDGYELAELLRGEEKTRYLPIIFLTAVYSDDHHIFKGYDTGAVDFITKPYDPRLLLSKARVYIDLDRQKSQRLEYQAKMQALIHISARVLAETSIEGLLRQIVDSARELTEARLAASAYGYQNGMFRLSATSRAEDILPCALGEPYCINQGGVYLELMLKHQALRLTDEELRDHPAWRETPEGHVPLRGLLGSPLRGHGGVPDGLIMVSDKEAGEFTAEDEALLVQLAALASLGLQHIEARYELELRVKERTAELEAVVKELRLSEEHFRRTFDQAPIGAAIVGLDYRFQRVNDALCRITGYTQDELISRSFVEITHPEDLAEDLEEVRRLTDGQTTQYQMEERYIRKDGKVVWVNLSVRCMRNAEGEPLYFLPMIEDITERKEAEEKLQTYMVKLERSNAELEEFAFIASHDLQEPLRKIGMFSDLLVKRSSACLEEKSRDYIDRIQSAVGRMQALLQALLRYSRLTTEVHPLGLVDLTQAAGEALSDLELALEETGGHVEIAALPALKADPVQMRQLFQNLIANAIKYRSNGNPPLIKVHGAVDGGVCRICVEDNGIGFDEKYLDRIFKPFQRLHTHSDYTGTGMGLAICRKIVERHGGAITARSAPGQGSTFIVSLPVLAKALVES